MKLRQQILIILLLSVGCTQSFTVTSLDAINEATINREVTVRLNDQSVSSGKEFRIDSDSARWIDADGGLRIISSRSIESVQIKNRSRGATYGWIIGAAGCAALGAVMYGEGDGEWFSRGTAAAGGALLGGFGGCLCGSLIGTTDQLSVPDTLLKDSDHIGAVGSIDSVKHLEPARIPIMRGGNQ